MLINRANLQTLGVAFNTAFNAGLGQGASLWPNVATRVPSSTKENEYGWLGKIPNVREWLGDRQVQNLSSSDYRIKNRPFELTVGVDRDDISDDNIGIYAPLMQELGSSTGSAYDLAIWDLLKAGFSTPCYDKQYFFDTDHPVLNAAGETVSVANTDGGAGTPWFLIDDTRSLKPLILQVREDWKFVAKDRIDDDNVFHQRKFIYGVEGRYAAGYGFWQFSWGSKQSLDATHYAAARAAMQSLKGDFGRPLGVRPTLLIVPPALEEAALKLLNSEYAAGGETNPWKGTAKLLVVPWLA